VTLPVLLSVPHAGRTVPGEVAGACRLTEEEIAADGDGGAREIYALAARVAVFVTTEIARAVVDMNRAESDRRRDGVVKTHTCWDVPIWREPLTDEAVARLLDRYWRPYHRALSEGARTAAVGLDCHTMAATGPPVGPDTGRARPALCVSNAGGTCPEPWLEGLAASLEEVFGVPAAINDPFRGGYIVRAHAHELPWVQLELSRAPFAGLQEKRASVLAALERWCRRLGLA
jgi:N-formylglutamate amidohydrolase